MRIEMAAGVIDHQLFEYLGPVSSASAIQDIFWPEFRQCEVVKGPAVDWKEFDPEFLTGFGEELQRLTVL